MSMRGTFFDREMYQQVKFYIIIINYYYFETKIFNLQNN